MIKVKRVFEEVTQILTLLVTSLSFLTVISYNDSSVLAATYNLKAYPLSGTEVQLEWESNVNSDYDIWQTTDGKSWSKVSTLIAGGQYTRLDEPNYNPVTDEQSWSVRSVYTYTYTVSSGIFSYRNYYFAVTVKDQILQYPEGVTPDNASNEAVAFPPHQLGHGYFSKNTNLCANCHTMHYATSPKLITFATVNDACISCHDGTQSKYNVLDGTVVNDGTVSQPLESLAGPFGSILNKIATSSPVTIHSLDQPLNSAPGGNPGNGLTEPLNCGSCHDPHFNPNYRGLRKILPENSNVTVEGYAYTNLATGKEDSYYSFGQSNFCMGCHKDYMAPKGSGSLPAAGTYQTDGKYRHPIGVSILQFAKGALATSLPLEGALPNNNYVSCITCHFSHGSEKQTTDSSNYLLRRDYRGVCEDCHKK